MLYIKPRIVSVTAAHELIQGSTIKQTQNFADNNPLLPECTVPAYEADE